MIRIGMIGADSTHTEAWSRLVNLPDAPLYGQAQVVKLWGEDRDQASAKANDCRIPAVVDTPAEALEDVDLAMIVNRYGDDHPPYARLAIEAGLPTFVDKPFANEMEDVHQLVGLAQQRNAPLTSCSALRYAGEVMELQEKMAAFGPLNCAIVSGAAAGDFPDPRAKHPFFYGMNSARGTVRPLSSAERTSAAMIAITSTAQATGNGGSPPAAICMTRASVPA